MRPSSFSRRQFARMALSGAAAALLPISSEAQTSAAGASLSPSESTALSNVVPFNAGYALSRTQAGEVTAALKDYQTAFAKARAYAVPDDVAPAWVGSLPLPGAGKVRK